MNLELDGKVALIGGSSKGLGKGCALELAKDREETPWLDVDMAAKSGTYKETPEIADLPHEFKVNLVVELYSK